MVRLNAIVIALLLSILSPTHSAAVTPKAGTTCPKAGKVQVSGDLKYTCLKSGKQLIWGKGVKVLPSNANTSSSELKKCQSEIGSKIQAGLVYICEIVSGKRVYRWVAPTDGLICFELGFSFINAGTTFRCKNINGKLSWQGDVPVKKVVPKPTTSAAPVEPKPTTPAAPVEPIDSPLSRIAALNKTSYENLACDPFDPAIKEIALPNGVGPEARAAAACVALEYVKNKNKNDPSIDVFASPSLPDWYVKIFKDSTRVGDQIFGSYGSSNRKYILLVSDDPEWLCSKGKEVLDPILAQTDRVTPNGTIPSNGWAGFNSSGCAGSTNDGYVHPYLIGKDFNISLTYKLLPIKFNSVASDIYKVGTEVFFNQAIAHEFVHTTLFQRGKSFRNGYAEPGWYGEGQADYLGWSASTLAFNSPDLRGFQLSSLKRSMGKSKLTTVNIEETPNAADSQMIYTAGYFAYEYLLAHYGLEKTWQLWDSWGNSNCSSVERRFCWKVNVERDLGLTSVQLNARLNQYINAQNGTQVTCNPSSPISTYKKLPTYISAIGRAAALCIADSWERNVTLKAIVNFYGYPAAPEFKAALTSMIQIGYQLTNGLSTNPRSATNIILADSPSTACQALTDLLKDAGNKDWILSQPWSGCLANPPVAPHTWANYDSQNCGSTAGLVNAPFTVTGNARSDEKYILFSRCADFLNRSEESQSYIRKSLQANFITLNSGGRRYWFESGLEAWLSTYGYSLYKKNDYNFYGLGNRAPSEDINSDSAVVNFLKKNKNFSVASLNDNGNDSTPNLLYAIMGNMSSEYVIGVYGLEKALELIKGWNQVSGSNSRSGVTKAILGISDEELFADMDAYIEFAIEKF